jgi:CTP synthase
MRLGSYSCRLEKGSIAQKCYNKNIIEERHRHRFEFNNDFTNHFQEKGMMATGFNPESKLVEIVEIPSHPFFIGVQFHPEYKSTVTNPQPLFVGFVDAAINYSKSKL